MITLRLKEDEVRMLEEILSDYLSDLRMEIADTDQGDFREQLKKKEEFIKSQLSKLRTKGSGLES